MVSVSNTDGTVPTAYDADGNRVRTSVTPATGPPTVTDFLVDPSGPLAQVVARRTSRAWRAPTTSAATTCWPSCGRTGRPAVGGRRFYHADGLGSVRRLTDEGGAVTDTYEYTAFGELLTHTGTDPQPYAFAGEPLDPNIGFQYHRARWMDPRAVSRLVGIDPHPGRLDQNLP